MNPSLNLPPSGSRMLKSTCELRACARPTPLWPIGFHCQQAVEKCLKAELVLRGVTPDKTHRLGDLAKELLALAVPLPIPVVELLLLTPFGIDEKYPRVKPGRVAAGDAAVLNRHG